MLLWSISTSIVTLSAAAYVAHLSGLQTLTCINWDKHDRNFQDKRESLNQNKGSGKAGKDQRGSLKRYSEMAFIKHSWRGITLRIQIRHGIHILGFKSCVIWSGGRWRSHVVRVVTLPSVNSQQKLALWHNWTTDSHCEWTAMQVLTISTVAGTTAFFKSKANTHKQSAQPHSAPLTSRPTAQHLLEPWMTV